MFPQIFNMVNVGIVVLDKEMKVVSWNHWMETHSNISAKDIVGTLMFQHFPDINKPHFNRNSKSVFKFGNFAFFSQKIHHYLFPFQAESFGGISFDFMQQNCTMGPLRNEQGEIEHIFISVTDVTEMASYEKKLLEMSIKDELTGVYNRRFFMNRLDEEIVRHTRYKRKMTLCMLDIDFFKKINDTYGHQCGDFVLKKLCTILGNTMREVDFLARYGGEEFCCVFPETESKYGVIGAERLCRAIAEQPFVYNEQNIKVRISIGVAGLIAGDSSEQLLKRTDDALYEAKETGRNRVVLSIE